MESQMELYENHDGTPKSTLDPMELHTNHNGTHHANSHKAENATEPLVISNIEFKGKSSPVKNPEMGYPDPSLIASLVSLDEKRDPRDTAVYKRRWYVLILYTAASVIHLACWNSFNPIASSAKAAFEWDNKQIALLTGIGPFAVILSLLPASWLVKKHGIRYPMLIASGLVFLGSVLRGLPLDVFWYRYISVVAAVLNGIAGAYYIAGATTLSAAWFPAAQRTTATSIYTFSRPLGLSVTFLIGPAFICDDSCTRIPKNNDTSIISNCTNDDIFTMQKDIKKLFYIETALIGVCFLLALIYFPSVPAKPPSISAGLKREKYLMNDIKQLLKKWDVWVVALAYSLTTAVNNSWLSCINVLWTPMGISQQKAGFIVFLATTGGAIANPLLGELASIFRRHVKLILILVNIFGTCFSLWAVLMTLGYLPVEDAYLYISVITCISLFSGCIPLYLEMSCEICYPVSEGVTTSFMTVFLESTIVLFFAVFFIPDMSLDWINWLFGVSTMISIVLCCLFRPQYQRLKLDELDI